MNEEADSRPDDGQSTRELILRAAERLFAEQGIDQTSVRQITLAAGQRNASATQYHFGSRDSLLEAILENGRANINRRRLTRLAELKAQGCDTDVRGLAESLVLPIAECLDATDGSQYYIAIAAQLFGHPQLSSLAQFRSTHTDSMLRLIDALHRALPELPASVIHHRGGMVLRQTFHELADFQRLWLWTDRRDSANVPLFLVGLVDAVTAVLSAPLSDTYRETIGDQSVRGV